MSGELDSSSSGQGRPPPALPRRAIIRVNVWILRRGGVEDSLSKAASHILERFPEKKFGWLAEFWIPGTAGRVGLALSTGVCSR